MKHLTFSRKNQKPAQPHPLMDQFFKDWQNLPSLWSKNFGDSSLDFQPQFEIKQKDEHIEVTAELAGLKPEDVDIHLEADYLSIRGEKKEEKEQDDKARYYSERSYGYFERSFQLPYEVDQEKAKASFKDGLLKISLEKRGDKRESTRKIPIQS